METSKNWILAPLADCVLDASCVNKVRAGMYDCSGCIGDGKRINLSMIRKIEVIIDAFDKIHVVSISQ